MLLVHIINCTSECMYARTGSFTLFFSIHLSTQYVCMSVMQSSYIKSTKIHSIRPTLKVTVDFFVEHYFFVVDWQPSTFLLILLFASNWPLLFQLYMNSEHVMFKHLSIPTFFVCLHRFINGSFVNELNLHF